ncbi:FibroRumin system radical SAM peptide maturase [Petroclostridium sp. X23]|uniref:FibroRumin system radical SAM peptide maturase n=1 Tax=Petroclostridium sp. X23 TaxID=3045146 RepID=UPI0024AD2AAE|nr:FibroRumin system radical SAM peptide maturase [Petroclostridium sp. X23]WHH59486.1 FibroRumin system radical SAM peptide maturase [Petroclostridium sp. X23]
MKLSKYTSIFEKDNVYAYYHSLRMKPVYVNEQYHKYIQEIVLADNSEQAIDNLPEAYKQQMTLLLKALQNNKIIIEDENYDIKVLNMLREKLPKPSIQVAYFIMSELCNLACSYCFIENSMDENAIRQKIMTKETVKQGLDFFTKQILLDMDSFEDEKAIIIYGGEPLTNFEVVQYLLDMIDEYKADKRLPERTTVSMITNGTLLSKEIAQILKERNVSVSISLDGATAVENSCRKYRNGDEAYRDIIKGVENATEAEIDCSLSVTLTEETIKDLSQIETMVDEYNIKSLGFNIIMTDETFSVSEEYNEEASEFILNAFEVFRKKGIYEDRIMRKAKAFVDAKIYLYDCAAVGGNQIIIAPNGQVGICHGYLYNRDYFPTTIDNLEFDPVKDDVYLEWSRRTPVNMDECVDCSALGICGGGCPLSAKKNGKNQSIWDLDERFCVHAKKTLEWLIWDLYAKSVKQ